MIAVSDKSRCCGCAACTAACPVGCISMQYDAEGSEYPIVDESACIGCGKCERVCRVLNPVLEQPCPQRAFLVQHSNSKVLLQSTSGGAFTALAQAVLSRGGVVFGHGYLRGDMKSRVVAFARVVEVDADAACEGMCEMTTSVPVNPDRDAFMSDIELLGADTFDKWLPDTPRAKAEHFACLTTERLGIYDQAKRFAKRC